MLVSKGSTHTHTHIHTHTHATRFPHQCGLVGVVDHPSLLEHWGWWRLLVSHGHTSHSLELNVVGGVHVLGSVVLWAVVAGRVFSTRLFSYGVHWSTHVGRLLLCGRGVRGCVGKGNTDVWVGVVWGCVSVNNCMKNTVIDKCVINNTVVFHIDWQSNNNCVIWVYCQYIYTKACGANIFKTPPTCWQQWVNSPWGQSARHWRTKRSDSPPSHCPLQ